MISSDLYPHLSQYKKNMYSQFGEDGIIEEVLTRLSRVTSLDKWCVEFGAWDGLHHSNTCNLIKNKNYKAVLIEANSKKYKQLCKNFPSEEIIKICKFVSFDGDSTLDKILQNTPISKNFDFLSIDIDGCDYFIFESLLSFQPKIICIEYNPSIPNEVDYIQPKEFSVKHSSSAKSITKLGIEKGYSLVASTYCNLFLIRKEFVENVIGFGDYTLETFRDDSEARLFIFFGQDGTIITSKPVLHLPWHGIIINNKNIQKIPKYIRKFPGDYNVLQKILFWIFLFFKYPSQFRIRFSKLITRLLRKIGRKLFRVGRK